MKNQAIRTLESAVTMLEGLRTDDFQKVRRRLYGENTFLIDPRTEQIQMVAKLHYMMSQIEQGHLVITDDYKQADWETLYKFYFFILKGESNEKQAKKPRKKSKQPE